jgi:uncharacterized protein (TIGR02246 family)
MRPHNFAAKLAGLTLCIALNACVTPVETFSNHDDRTALEQIRARILEAELKGDASVFEQVAAPDVVVIPPDATAIHGKDASVEMMRQFFSKNQLHIEYANAQVQVNQDQAFDRGTYSQTVTPKDGGAPITGKGSYWWFYARNEDGNWRQTRVIWTND